MYQFKANGLQDGSFDRDDLPFFSEKLLGPSSTLPERFVASIILKLYVSEPLRLDVPLDAFRLEQLPAHQLMNFRVVDEHGRQLGMSRNFAQLRGEWAPKQTIAPIAVATKSAAPQQKTSGERYTEWRFGDFKPTREETRAGQTVTVFNALVDEGDAVTLQSFDTREVAQAAQRLGLRRLFQLALKEQVKYLEKNLPGLQAMAMQFLPFGSQQDLQRQILAVTFDRCCLNDPWPETEKEFAARCKEAKARLNLVAQEIARLVGAVLAEHQALQKALPGFKAHGAAGAKHPVPLALALMLNSRGRNTYCLQNTTSCLASNPNATTNAALVGTWTGTYNPNQTAGWVAETYPLDSFGRRATIDENQAFVGVRNGAGRFPLLATVDLAHLLQHLGAMAINSLMVERGAQIITSFLGSRLVDQVVLTIASKQKARFPQIPCT